MRKILILILYILICQSTIAQKKIAITIDDIPKTKLFLKNNFQSKLLNKLDSMAIPTTIFINENQIYKTEFITESYKLLNSWAENKYTTLGNHTYSHMRFSEANLDTFSSDIIKGETITRELSKKYNKPLKYFRFPYNDLSTDSLKLKLIRTFLSENNYSIAPFTIESSDWVYGYIYEYYLNQNNIKEANKIADSYINKTIEYVEYFDSITQKQYGRSINHIYLCHDNSINADCIHIIVRKLQELGYTIISLDEALKDDVYNQPIHYYCNWGISWVYRWMKDKDVRDSLMRKEPGITEIYNLYKSLSKK